MYIVPFDLFAKLSTLPQFKSIYKVSYNDYIIDIIKPSMILKEMIEEASTPKDILEIIKFFDIDYTHDYYHLIDTVLTNTNLDKSYVGDIDINDTLALQDTVNSVDFANISLQIEN